MGITKTAAAAAVMLAAALLGCRGPARPCVSVVSLAAHAQDRCPARVPEALPELAWARRDCAANAICKREAGVVNAGAGNIAATTGGAGAEAPPLSMSDERLAAGATVFIPYLHDRSVFALVVEGAVVAHDTRGAAGWEPRLDAWQAVRASRGGLTLTAPAEGARVFLFFVAAGPAPLDVRSIPVRAQPRARAPDVVSLAAARDLVFAKGAVRARIALEAPASREASLGALFARKDAGVPLHLHDKEWEHLLLLDGEGAFLTPERAPAERVVRAGDLVHVPPGVRHGFRAAGTRPLVGVQLYTPPGPEQRFKKLAAPAARAP